jgi:hypothetical protein
VDLVRRFAFLRLGVTRWVPSLCGAPENICITPPLWAPIFLCGDWVRQLRDSPPLVGTSTETWLSCGSELQIKSLVSRFVCVHHPFSNPRCLFWINLHICVVACYIILPPSELLIKRISINSLNSWSNHFRFPASGWPCLLVRVTRPAGDPNIELGWPDIWSAAKFVQEFLKVIIFTPLGITRSFHWAGCLDSRRSNSGYCAFLDNILVS